MHPTIYIIICKCKCIIKCIIICYLLGIINIYFIKLNIISGALQVHYSSWGCQYFPIFEFVMIIGN